MTGAAASAPPRYEAIRRGRQHRYCSHKLGGKRRSGRREKRKTERVAADGRLGFFFLFFQLVTLQRSQMTADFLSSHFWSFFKKNRAELNEEMLLLQGKKKRVSADPCLAGFVCEIVAVL